VPDTHVQHASALKELLAAGQSCWLDDLTRRMIDKGELAALVAAGVRGVTANPATFSKAITGESEYDRDIERGLAAGLEPQAAYEHLAVADVRAACDILRREYEASQGADGFVSLEVSPRLAYDTAASIAEAKRLWAAVGRPNLFIKIPGTEAGLPAIEACLADGVNINITLLFSVERYERVAEAYLRALERRAAAGQPVERIASVASFFLSRIDVLIDETLKDAPALNGKAAVANAKLAYQSFKRLFAGKRWTALEERGARVQRLLWASTGRKNPAYPELLYVEPLIGAMTVNTMPLATIEAFRRGGVVAATLERGVEEAYDVMDALRRCGRRRGAARERGRR
jgi:transketolase